MYNLLPNKIKFHSPKISKVQIKNILTLIFFLFVFKSINYVAPILLYHNLNSDSEFGIFEYNLNLGQILSNLMGFGLAGSYGYFIVKESKYKYITIYHLHYLILTCTLILFLVFNINLLHSSIFNYLLIATLLANQVLISTIEKNIGNNILAIFLDSTIYIALFVMIILSSIFKIKFNIFNWNLILFSILVYNLIFVHIKFILSDFNVKFIDFFNVYKHSILLLSSGILILLLCASTRLYIDFFLNKNDLGIFSYYFRISSIVLIFHRAIFILLYNKLFTNDHNTLDSIYYKISLSIAIIIAIILIALFLINFFHKETLSIYNLDNLYLLYLCMSFIFFWSFGSMFEVIFNREKLMKPFLLMIITILFIFCVSLYTLSIYQLLNLNNLIIINTLCVIIYIYSQLYVLNKFSIYYRYSIKSAIIFSFLYILSIIFL